MSEDYNIHIIHALEKITEKISRLNNNPNIIDDVSDIKSDLEKAKKELYNNCSDGK